MSSVSLGHAATYPDVGGNQSPSSSCDPTECGSLTGCAGPQNEGDRQPRDF